MVDVVIGSDGGFKVDGKRFSSSSLRSKMRKLRGKTVTISPSPNAPIEKVAMVMDLAMVNKVTAILAAEK